MDKKPKAEVGKKGVHLSVEVGRSYINGVYICSSIVSVSTHVKQTFV